jgi:hypothetical protein
MNYVTRLRRDRPIFFPKAHKERAECELCDQEAHLLLTATCICRIFREAVFPTAVAVFDSFTLAVR